MTVKELLDILKDVDPALEVLITDEYTTDALETVEITDEGTVLLSIFSPENLDEMGDEWDLLEEF